MSKVALDLTKQFVYMGIEREVRTCIACFLKLITQTGILTVGTMMKITVILKISNFVLSANLVFRRMNCVCFSQKLASEDPALLN